MVMLLLLLLFFNLYIHSRSDGFIKKKIYPYKNHVKRKIDARIADYAADIEITDSKK